MIDRGDIRWFRFEAPDKRRPVLVLGRDDVLPMLTQIPVIPSRHRFEGCAGRSGSRLPTDSPPTAC